MPVVGRKHDYLNATYGSHDTTFVTKNAPFGNNDSQLQRIRIVGGQRFYVKEDPNWPEKAKKSVEMLHACSPISRTWSKQRTVDHTPLSPPPIPQSINKFDLTDYWKQRSKTNQSQGDASILKSAQSNVPVTTKASLNPHPVLPPIDETLDRITAQTASGDSTECLAKYIPSTAYLAPQAINLSRQDELLLKQRIGQGLGSNFMNEKLKEVYNELVDYDEDLTGYVAYTNIGYALLRSQVHLSVVDLRLLCSMYVSASDARKVNYEKVLSFIAASCNSQGDRGKRKTSHANETDRPSLRALKVSSRTISDSEERQISWQPFLDEIERTVVQKSKDTLISPRYQNQSIKSLESEAPSTDSSKQNIKSETKDRRTGNKRPESSPWFDRFMNMAKAFYLVDAENTGHLPLTNAKWLVEEYNSVYNLALPSDKIEDAVQESSLYEHGKRGVSIDNLLRQLIKLAP